MAEEIIHCEDCKFHTDLWYCEAWNNSPGFPMVEDDGYCWLGKPKEEQIDKKYG